MGWLSSLTSVSLAELSSLSGEVASEVFGLLENGLDRQTTTAYRAESYRMISLYEFAIVQRRIPSEVSSPLLLPQITCRPAAAAAVSLSEI
jgi:hypothetical protein